MLSVIAPNCNESGVVPAFMYSLANQTYKSYELIIVDCFSSDGSIDMLWRLSEKTRGVHIVLTDVKNMGIVRNRGANAAKGAVMFHTNSDVFLPGQLLKKISRRFMLNSDLAALSGRTIQLNCSLLKRLANDYYDVLRSIFAYFHIFRPGGSFIAIRSAIFKKINGFPKHLINEDADLGNRLTPYLTRLALDLHVFHYGKPGRGVLFYMYAVANFMPFLKPLCTHLAKISAQRYYDRPC